MNLATFCTSLPIQCVPSINRLQQYKSGINVLSFKWKIWVRLLKKIELYIWSEKQCKPSLSWLKKTCQQDGLRLQSFQNMRGRKEEMKRFFGAALSSHITWASTRRLQYSSCCFSDYCLLLLCIHILYFRAFCCSYPDRRIMSKQVVYQCLAQAFFHKTNEKTCFRNQTS